MTTIGIPTYDVLLRDYPPLVSVMQLAAITGIHGRTYRDWMRRGTMPVPILRLGGALRFRLIDVAQWIDGQVSLGAQQGIEEVGGTLPLLPRRKRGRPKKAESLARDRQSSQQK